MGPPLAKRDTNSTPPAPARGQKDKKNLHSPWSAQRNKKRPNLKCEPAPLAIINEDYCSPPKRRNGGTSPAWESRLPVTSLAVEGARTENAGPLAQGLLLSAHIPFGDGFSPLASGLKSSFSFSAGVSKPCGTFLTSAGSQEQREVVICDHLKGTARLAGQAAHLLPTTRLPQHTEGFKRSQVSSLGQSSILKPGTASAEFLPAIADFPRPASRITDHSVRSNAEMELDLRSSWGSERSADVLPWREMQARLQHEHIALQSARNHLSSGLCSRNDPMHASLDSLHESLDAPSCTERQASNIPLRTSIKGPWQQSHVPLSPTIDGVMCKPAAAHSPARQHQPPSSQKHRGTCFLCPSPFCKPHKQGAIDADEYEVVRRTNSEEFVLHRTHSFNAGSRERPLAGKMRRESLNRPPSPADLVHRQDGFSAKCCSSPVHHLSPQSACSDLSAPPYSRSQDFEQAAFSEELLASLRDNEHNPTIDELNNMLRSFCTLDFHPKDAEELVEEACKSGQLAPNATTLRTLDKIWAAHEQMYG